MTKYWTLIKAILAAVMNFFWIRKADEAAAHQEAQAAQDQLVEDTHEAINEVHGETDADLLDTAVDIGLVQRETTGPGRSGGLGTGDSDLSGRAPGAPFKTRR